MEVRSARTPRSCVFDGPRSKGQSAIRWSCPSRIIGARRQCWSQQVFPLCFGVWHTRQVSPVWKGSPCPAGSGIWDVSLGIIVRSDDALAHLFFWRQHKHGVPTRDPNCLLSTFQWFSSEINSKSLANIPVEQYLAPRHSRHFAKLL